MFRASRISIRVRQSEVRIRGSGSILESHESATLEQRMLADRQIQGNLLLMELKMIWFIGKYVLRQQIAVLRLKMNVKYF
jgi:hypothetical protein